MAIDKNGDGKIAKPELFEILKKLINGWVTNRFLKYDLFEVYRFYYQSQQLFNLNLLI